MKAEKVLSAEEIYYQLYPDEEDDMEGMRHAELVNYLFELLKWYYRFEQVVITDDLPITLGKVQAAADLAVVKGVSLTEAEVDKLDSWDLYQPNRPSPVVAFEISSKNTWGRDVNSGTKDKPTRYGQLGVKEYYAYDPVGHWQKSNVNLRAWRYKNGQPVEQKADKLGRFWSDELDSYLVPDGSWLRLTDREGNRRLTKAEAQERRAEAERQRAEKMELELKALLEKLKAHNIDPDKL
jgi:Uma2 family endonuclease